MACRKRGHRSSWIWRPTRYRIYARDDHRCLWCGFGACHTDELTLDHLVPRSRGGTNRPSNIVTACRSCNSKRKELPWRQWLRASGRFSAEVLRRVRRVCRRRLPELDVSRYRASKRAGAVVDFGAAEGSRGGGALPRSAAPLWQQWARATSELARWRDAMGAGDACLL